MLNSEACKTWYLVQLNLKYLRYEESKIATMAMSGAVGADLDLNPLDFASAISQQHFIRRTAHCHIRYQRLCGTTHIKHNKLYNIDKYFLVYIL